MAWSLLASIRLSYHEIINNKRIILYLEEMLS